MSKIGLVSGFFKYVGEGCSEEVYLKDMVVQIVFIDRGICKFFEKVVLVAKAGVIVVIIINYEGDDIFPMKGSGFNNIVVVMIGKFNG